MSLGYTQKQYFSMLTVNPCKTILKTAFPNNKTKKEVFIMASAKKTLNPLTDTPTNKVEITKPFMLAYMRQVASEDDKAWFKKIVADANNQKEYVNKLNGQPYTDIDIPKVRKLFTDRFFPQLNAKKEKNKSFIDSILDL